MRFDFVYKLLSETFLIVRRNERDMITINFGLLVKCPLFLSDFKEFSVSSTDFQNIHKRQIS